MRTTAPILAAAVIAAAIASSGCVTGAAIAKPNRVKLPVLIAAVVADLLVTALGASQLDGFSNEGAVFTGIAITGVDTGIGCVLGACSSLRP